MEGLRQPGGRYETTSKFCGLDGCQHLHEEGEAEVSRNDIDALGTHG